MNDLFIKFSRLFQMKMILFLTFCLVKLSEIFHSCIKKTKNLFLKTVNHCRDEILTFLKPFLRRKFKSRWGQVSLFFFFFSFFFGWFSFSIFKNSSKLLFSRFQLNDSCHGDSSIKGRDFTEVIILS